MGPVVIVILGLLAVMAPPAAAPQGRPQLKRPEQTPQEKLPEETKPKKKIKGPRAVGLLQLTASGKGTLIPIAILVDGKFYDASAYKADPVPMALDPGTVYEAEQAGDSLGLFTVSGALHSKTAGSPHPWVGAGSYLPQGAEAPTSRRKAEDVPVGMDTSGTDEPPRLTRGNKSKPAAAASPTPASGSSTPPGTGSSEKPGAGAPPGSSQPAGGSSSGPSSGSSAGSSAGASPGQDAQRPTVPPASDKPADKSVKPAGQASSSQAPPSQDQTSDSYYRPTLRRGKPTQSAPQENDPAPAGKSKADESKTGKPESPGAAAAVSAEPIQLVPAISDAGGPDPRPYKFYWKSGEEEERRNQMLALAADEVRAYANALAKNRIPANPPAPAKPPATKPPAAAKATTPGHKAPAKPAPPVFESIQFRAFDVWANSQPVMILSAESHFPPVPRAATAPEQYSITLVARTDIYGNLRKLYSGVTDKFHLDVTPRLELIDVVDADGDGRGELLFRETTDAGSGYVIYRASADKLGKMFDSLGE
jgi:hypothetical protein